MEPRFNEPPYNVVLGITNDILQPGQSYSKMYGTEPRYNEILVITGTAQEPKRKMYPGITKSDGKDECETNQEGLSVLEILAVVFYC